MGNNTEILRQFDYTQQALITVHEFPDIDAVGSALALYSYLKSYNKEATIWISQPLDNNFDFLPNIDVIVNQIPNNFVYDTIFILDCSNTDRVRNFAKLPISDQIIVNIDHHPDNERFGNINYVKLVSSVGEILTQLFIDSNFNFTKEIATCLYAAIIFDTGRFAYSNVTSQTLSLASTLMKHGASNVKINASMEENKSIKDFMQIKAAINELQIIDDYQIAYTTIVVQKSIKIKVIDFIRQLKNINIFIVFQILNDNLIKINLRSQNNFDVSSFSKQFGGGGHRKASGILYKGSLENCQNEILTALKESL